MTKPIILVKILVLALIHEASKEFFLWLPLDRPTANALSIFLAGLSLYFLIPTGISARKYILTLSGISLWYWLVMKPLLNALKVRMGNWSFIVCLLVMLIPFLLWKIQERQPKTEDLDPKD